MKQKKFGDKIQNWHRPLGKSDLSWRYLRRRHDDPEAVADARELTHISRDELGDDRAEVNQFWNCYDPYAGCYVDRDYNGDPLEADGWDDLVYHHIENFFRNKAYPKSPLVPSDLPLTRDRRYDSHEELPLEQANDLALRVWDYTHRLPSFSKNIQFFEEEFGQRVNPQDIKDLSQIKLSDAKDRFILENLILLAPFWLRRPAAWDQKGGTLQLIRHLLVRFDVPHFLWIIWRCGENYANRYDVSVNGLLDQRLKWLIWFLLLAQGGSLKRAAAKFGWSIHDRFQHHLNDVPLGVSPLEACVIAEVHRLGGNEIDYRRILGCHAFVVDPTDVGRSSYTRFWQETVAWIISKRDQLTDEQCSVALDWAMHLYTEAERGNSQQQYFTWKGRQVRSVIEQSTEYREGLYRSYNRNRTNYRWDSHGWDWQYCDWANREWKFVELVSSIELQEEGAAMQHCVGGYDGRCAAGASAIVSLRQGDKRKLTIEIAPRVLKIVQARGKCNRRETVEEATVIRAWINYLRESKPSIQ